MADESSKTMREANTMTSRSVLTTSFILAVLSTTACLTALGADPEIQRGDTVVVSKDGARLRLKERVVATLSKGQQLKVHQVSGRWLGTYLVVDGAKKGGWIHMSDVALPGAPAMTPAPKPVAEPGDQEPARPDPAAAASPASGPPQAVAPFDSEQARQHQQAWAKHLKVPAQRSNSIGMKLVLIPPGEFMMGSPDSDAAARDNEKPQHRVRITRPYYLGMHEVTLGQFRQFVQESPGVRGKQENRGSLTDDHPVSGVSWPEAIGFCKWLSKKEGESYRLPTEAEWEYACRAGTQTRFSFGQDGQLLGEYAWHPGNAKHSRTHPVGQKKPNPWGLYDMHGNVLEWCLDESRDYSSGEQVDPVSLSTSGFFKRGRGGSWDDYQERSCRSAYRGGWGATSHGGPHDMGFRVVLEIPAARSSIPASMPVWTLVDSSGTKWETPLLLFDPKDRAYERFEGHGPSVVVVKAQHYDLGIALYADLISVQQNDGVVKVEYRDTLRRKNTVTGELGAGEFHGSTGLVEFRISSDKVAQISLTPAPKTYQGGTPPRPSAIINLNKGDRIEAMNIMRTDSYFTYKGFIGGGRTVYRQYGDIRFRSESSLTTVEFQQLRRIALPGGNKTILSLKDGSQVTGELVEDNDARLEGFFGECVQGHFHVKAYRVDSVEFLDP